MQRTSDSRKKFLKKPSTTTANTSLIPSTPIISTPDHPGCWRIISNQNLPSPSTLTVNSSHPYIHYRQSVFSIHDRIYTRLSFQNYNKRIEPLMIKYGLKEDLNNLEDGEIDPNDEDNETENVKKSFDDESETKHSTTLGSTMRKKFQKKSFSRTQFDNKSRISKRRRRTRPGNSTH